MIEIPKDPKNQRYWQGVGRDVPPAPAWGTAPEGKVWVRCPECRTSPMISESHEIAADGTVSPSIWHQCGTSGANDSGADWHVFGKLLDY